MKRLSHFLLAAVLCGAFCLSFGGCEEQDAPAPDPTPTISSTAAPQTIAAPQSTTAAPQSALSAADMADRLEAVFRRYIEENPRPETYAGIYRPMGRGDLMICATDEKTLDVFREAMDAAIPAEKAAWLREAGVEPDSEAAWAYDDHVFVHYVRKDYSLAQLETVQEVLRGQRKALDIVRLEIRLSDNRVFVGFPFVPDGKLRETVLAAVPEELHGCLEIGTEITTPAAD